MDERQDKKRFITLLDNMERSKDRQQHFRHFCEMAYCALAKNTAPNEEVANRLEERYMEIVHSYPNKDDIRAMPEMVILTMNALNRGGCDFLGEIAGEIDALDKRNAQFFTPYDVAKMMALITLPDVGAIIREDGFFSTSDPAAGAGCMLLAAADVVESSGYDVMESMSVHAVELNKSTYHMLYVQLALRGIPAEVVHGNSLSLETFETAYTPVALHFARKHGCLFKTHESNTAQTSQNPVSAQLSLFDI